MAVWCHIAYPESATILPPCTRLGFNIKNIFEICFDMFLALDIWLKRLKLAYEISRRPDHSGKL
jgi:hypothetical protein